MFNRRTVHVLASGDGTPDQASVDIVALHGLGGDWNRSWTSFGYCWLRHALAPKFPSCRVLSLDYPGMLAALATQPLNINGLIHDIVRERREVGRTKSPIIFLGHSFGGTVFKQIYIATHPSNTDEADFQALHGLLRGYVFFGTLHKDKDMSRAQFDIPNLWRVLSRGATDTLGGYSGDLEKAMYMTFYVNHAFRRLNGEDLPTVCFYETQRVIGLAGNFVFTQEESTFVGRPVSSIPIDLDHQSLVRFRNQNDENLSRVLDILDSFMVLAMDPEIRRHRPQAVGSRGLALLSLDGGGVKGLFTIMVINRLIQETKRLEGPVSQHKKPCDYFDLIGGTSTGGLLAIMLGRLQMDAHDCIQAYKSLSKEVFTGKSSIPLLETVRKVTKVAVGGSWFEGDRLKDAVCRTIQDNLLPSDRIMLEQSACSVEDLTLVTDEMLSTYTFVCAMPQHEEKVQRIRSYLPLDSNIADTSKTPGRFKIWEAARATSAAPMYFPHICINGVYYFDGGLASNNPVIEVIREAKQEFPDDAIRTIISIGTGALGTPDASAGLTGLLQYMISMATSTERHHKTVLEDPGFASVREGYYRLNGGLNLGAIDLAAVERLEEIEQLAEDYLSSEQGRLLINTCAERLAERARTIVKQ